jgi:uncharacterized cofD-like protein
MLDKLNIVCFGGGTGLPSLLVGLKRNPWLNVTAVVNMFDTGGSSGELRDHFGILPPGDVLKCLLALANKEGYARNLLLKRIPHDRYPGHTGGNVLLMGLEKVYGSQIDAIDALGQLLFIRGRVVPVALEHSTLCMRYTDDTIARGETSVDMGIHEGKKPKELYLDPVVDASPQAINAIRNADAICIGPGSFYTSVLPNLLPHGIRQAITESAAPIIYVANLLQEGRGMYDHTIESSMATIESYAGRLVTFAVANDVWPQTHSPMKMRYVSEGKRPLVSRANDRASGLDCDPRIIFASLWQDNKIARHDSDRLAALIFTIIAEKVVFLRDRDPVVQGG